MDVRIGLNQIYLDGLNHVLKLPHIRLWNFEW